MYNAKILADSTAPSGVRLTTFEVTYPLMVHNELLTHRDFSRNAASSRAIPVKRMISQVMEDPFVPERFPKNQKGMQAAEFYEPGSQEYGAAKTVWLHARDNSIHSAKMLIGEFAPFVVEANEYCPSGFYSSLDVHKQIANRLLAPWQWITVVISATRYSNFFALRCHPDAQPEIRTIAEMMKGLYDSSIPDYVDNGRWHLPYVTQADRELASGMAWADYIEHLGKMSVARCARVSYMTHATDEQPARKATAEEDVALADRLAASGHWSPYEHVATPAPKAEHVSGNFYGWIQYRKTFAGECR